jgi:hypothetical protein
VRGYAIIAMAGGAPDLGDLTYYGYSLAAHIGQTWGLYVISGTGAQLAAIDALPQVYGICAVSASGAIHLASGLDDVIAAGARTRINTWLSARGYPSVPADWTYRQVITAIYQRVNSDFRVEACDVEDPN